MEWRSPGSRLLGWRYFASERQVMTSATHCSSRSTLPLIHAQPSLRAALLICATLLFSACAHRDAPASKAATLSPERIAEIVASPDRSEFDRKMDATRKPAQLLEFIGVRPGWKVLDLSTGGGYTAELLARAVGPTGLVIGQSEPRDPNRAPPPVPESGPLGAALRAALPPGPRLTSPEALAKRAENPAITTLQSVVQPFEAPAPAALANSGFDLATLFYNYHDLQHASVDRATMNRAIYAALKTGGLYIIIDHAGRPGTGISEAGTLHRMEEAFLIREVEAAGFKLAGSADFLRNPADPRDQVMPEPPMAKDQFVVKFVKP